MPYHIQLDLDITYHDFKYCMKISRFSTIHTGMLFFLWQMFLTSWGEYSSTALEILPLVRDCFGRAVWVRRITRRRMPANKRKSPSMPRWLMRIGFSFERRNVEVISRAIRTPTTVDLEHTIAFCLIMR